MKRLLPFLLLLLASPAAAASWSWGCSFTGNVTSTRPDKYDVGKKEVGCYRFTIADATTTSNIIRLTASSNLWCFDPDNTDAVADTARVIIHYCQTTTTPGTTGGLSANTCIALGGALTATTSLDGTEGDAFTQNACIRTGPGDFYIEVSVASAKTSTDYSQVMVKGEENAP